MVYRVTLKHAHGKISHEAVMDLVKRLDGTEHAEFRMTEDGIHFQTGDAEAVISHSSGEIVITPGSPSRIRATRIGELLVVPGMIMNAQNKKRNKKATNTATMAMMATLDADPADVHSNLFPDISPEEWEGIRNAMGVDDVQEIISPFASHQPAEARTIELSSSFTIQADHWTPPLTWMGRRGKDAAEYLNYPKGSPQFFVRQLPVDPWTILWDESMKAGGISWD
ncbi:MAG: hypothetical protein O3A74_05020 [archaeon]|nr:hypothetical protein [archaeon]